MTKQLWFICAPNLDIVCPIDDFLVNRFQLSWGRTLARASTSDLSNTSLFTSFVTCSKFAPNRMRLFAISLSIASCSSVSRETAMNSQISPGGGTRRSMSAKYGLSGRSSPSASFICYERFLIASYLWLRSSRLHLFYIFINDRKTLLFVITKS